MIELKITAKEEKDSLYLILDGPIDEFAVFGELDFSPYQRVSIDFGGVTSINSIGIREWMNLLKTLPAGASLNFLRCPRSIVDQINILAGFLPEGAIVDSLFVPYFCEGCRAEQGVLFTKDRHYYLHSQEREGSVIPPRIVPCTICNAPMTIDVIETKYFRFVYR